MGREVRRVPANWKHPVDTKGELIPLLLGPYSKSLAEWIEGNKKWDEGLVSDWRGGWKAKPEGAGDSFIEWHGEKPVPEDYMPEWAESEMTHLMMYETCTEGTPISPPCADKHTLAHWLADNGASAFGYETACYESWLATIEAGWSVSAVFTPGEGMKSGVELNGEEAKKITAQII
jgi:hypothetical protein